MPWCVVSGIYFCIETPCCQCDYTESTLYCRCDAVVPTVCSVHCILMSCIGPCESHRSARLLRWGQTRSWGGSLSFSSRLDLWIVSRFDLMYPIILICEAFYLQIYWASIYVSIHTFTYQFICRCTCRCSYLFLIFFLTLNYFRFRQLFSIISSYNCIIAWLYEYIMCSACRLCATRMPARKAWMYAWLVFSTPTVSISSTIFYVVNTYRCISGSFMLTQQKWIVVSSSLRKCSTEILRFFIALIHPKNRCDSGTVFKLLMPLATVSIELYIFEYAPNHFSLLTAVIPLAHGHLLVAQNNTCLSDFFLQGPVCILMTGALSLTSSFKASAYVPPSFPSLASHSFPPLVPSFIHLVFCTEQFLTVYN